MIKVEVKKQLISWARERAGLEVRDLIKPFPKFHEWEDGTSFPTLKQLEKLATRLCAPLGYFFLPAPPEERLPLKDFRTVSNDLIEQPSPNLLDTVFSMQQRQAWYKEFIIDEGAGPLTFVGSATTQNSPEQIASDIRRILAMNPGWASLIPTWTEALNELRVKVEDAGILAVWNGSVGNNTHRKLDTDEFLGFVLSDPYAPLIFINNADFKARQMFTLAHELAHVWLGSVGVLNFQNLNPVDSDVEQFCNKVAAEFLMPKDEAIEAWKSAKDSPDPFQLIARRFKVSPLVAGRRALDLGRITKQQFFDFYNAYWDNERRKMAAARKKGGGGDFYANCDFRIGRPFAEAIMRATHEGKLLYREAYKLTGLSGTTFDKYIRLVGSEGR